MTARARLQAAAGVLVVAVATTIGVTAAAGQGRGAASQATPASPRAVAPIDLTGTWVSVITESWRWRMVTPAKGDYAGVPITPKAFTEAEAWDPSRDEAAGEQCKAYGAAGLMRVPGRVRISWQDERTLTVEMDNGTQTRLLHFGAPPPSGRSWQGTSTAQWVTPPPGRGGGAAQTSPAGTSRFGYLKVTTMNLRAGYLRKNGVPYSANARLTEYWNVHQAPDGEQWLVVTSIVDDSEYLQEPYITSPNFRKEPDASKWKPEPCVAR